MGVLLLVLNPLVDFDAPLDAEQVGRTSGWVAPTPARHKGKVGRVDLGRGHCAGAEADARVLVGVAAQKRPPDTSCGQWYGS